MMQYSVGKRKRKKCPIETTAVKLSASVLIIQLNLLVADSDKISANDKKFGWHMWMRQSSGSLSSVSGV